MSKSDDLKLYFFTRTFYSHGGGSNDDDDDDDDVGRARRRDGRLANMHGSGWSSFVFVRCRAVDA